MACDHVGVEGAQGRATNEPVRGDDAVETGGPGVLVDGDREVHVAGAFGLQSRPALG